MTKSQLLQRTILKVSHIGIKLCHTVGNRSTCCKGNAFSTCQLVKVLALCKHIRGLLCFRLCDTRHIPHFRIKEQIFIIMWLVHKEPVHTKLLKSYHVVLPWCIVQFLKPCLQRLPWFFHLLDGISFPIVGFCLLNGKFNLINLAFYNGNLSFLWKRDFLKLRMTDNNRIIIPGGNSGTEFLPVGRLKIFLCSCKYIRSGIQS